MLRTNSTEQSMMDKISEGKELTPMTEGQKKSRMKRMQKAMKTPQSYLTETKLKEKEKWKNIKDDGLPRQQNKK